MQDDVFWSWWPWFLKYWVCKKYEDSNLFDLAISSLDLFVFYALQFTESVDMKSNTDHFASHWTRVENLVLFTFYLGEIIYYYPVF